VGDAGVGVFDDGLVFAFADSLHEIGDLALAFFHLDAVIGNEREARRIIAAVFQTLEAVE
jgi:hypothetical protein